MEGARLQRIRIALVETATTAMAMAQIGGTRRAARIRQSSSTAEPGPDAA